MQIKMLQSVVGPGLRLLPGKVYDLDEPRAAELVAAKFAVALAAPAAQKREKAVRPAAETR